MILHILRRLSVEELLICKCFINFKIFISTFLVKKIIVQKSREVKDLIPNKIVILSAIHRT